MTEQTPATPPAYKPSDAFLKQLARFAAIEADAAIGQKMARPHQWEGLENGHITYDIPLATSVLVRNFREIIQRQDVVGESLRAQLRALRPNHLSAGQIDTVLRDNQEILEALKKNPEKRETILKEKKAMFNAIGIEGIVTDPLFGPIMQDVSRYAQEHELYVMKYIQEHRERVQEDYKFRLERDIPPEQAARAAEKNCLGKAELLGEIQLRVRPQFILMAEYKALKARDHSGGMDEQHEKDLLAVCKKLYAVYKDDLANQGKKLLSEEAYLWAQGSRRYRKEHEQPEELKEKPPQKEQEMGAMPERETRWKVADVEAGEPLAAPLPAQAGIPVRQRVPGLAALGGLL